MKALKIAGIGIGIAVILIAAGLGFVAISPIPSYEVNVPDFKATVTDASVREGKRMAAMLCANCHMNRKTGRLTGAKMDDLPSEFGTIYSANITQDHTFGIGSWTDGELLYLLRTGIKKNGQYAPPYMPKFPNMSDKDINSIIAYLRSSEPEVQADPTPDRPAEPSLLIKLLCRVEFKPLPMPAMVIPPPDTTDIIALGKYLAHNLDCYACHSADFTKLDMLNPENSEGYFSGGNKPLNRQGQEMLTANLTPDPETGIGAWSEDKFVQAVKYGRKEGEPALRYPMMPYIYLEDYEVTAIYQYLKTVPPIKKKVQRSMLE
jgi:mono/diheme cytochrome c family protein